MVVTAPSPGNASILSHNNYKTISSTGAVVLHRESALRVLVADDNVDAATSVEFLPGRSDSTQRLRTTVLP